VCKQKCSGSNANRLYFQSVGDSNDPILTQIQNEEDPQELRCQVQRLENKVTGLNSLLERQGKDLKEVNDEVNSIAFCDFFFIIFVDFVLWII
jgi:TRAF-interacting protein